MKTFLNKIKFLGLMSIIVASSIVLTSNDSNATSSEAINEMYDSDSYFTNNGWSYKISDYGYLSQGNSYSYTFYAYAGNSYVCHSYGDSNVKDTDMVAYNSAGQYLSSDTRASKGAVIKFDKTYSGTVYVYVKMDRAYGGGGWYSLWCGYK